MLRWRRGQHLGMPQLHLCFYPVSDFQLYKRKVFNCVDKLLISAFQCIYLCAIENRNKERKTTKSICMQYAQVVDPDATLVSTT